MVLHNNLHHYFAKYLLFMDFGYVCFDHAHVSSEQVILQRNNLTCLVLTGKARDEFEKEWREKNELNN